MRIAPKRTSTKTTRALIQKLNLAGYSSVIIRESDVGGLEIVAYWIGKKEPRIDMDVALWRILDEFNLQWGAGNGGEKYHQHQLQSDAALTRGTYNLRRLDEHR